ncbi:MAG: signal recognition particle-docking protein FtsY [Candidatus Latescibacterota bacterium]|nr:signal recognition particle-docking protein FtsY [Candidatus Latescibacterota bacterium]OPX25743.1 MAG: signal recognition particle-docking protein FtsY [Candidatus Latescibacteria bacterium 4484_107]RKY66048.1 MAG: signal recognition particle-docking protein FtsY [Candidatus Latescibacterota bacterium]
MGKFLGRLRKGLSKTREGLLRRLGEVVGGRSKIDEELLEEIEEVLIEADVGVGPTTRIIEGIRERVKEERIRDPERIQGLLKDEVMRLLEDSGVELSEVAPQRRGGHKEPLEEGGGGLSGLRVSAGKPRVIMMVGVNGVGKTTTIGKLAQQYVDEGKKVLLAASDTFRAAAIEQLAIWADRTGADLVRHHSGADPASVAFDALAAAEARGVDVVIVDTAGRLHTKVNLMEELGKIHRVLGKRIPGAPHEVLLVLDATTGQNAISQVRKFDAIVHVTGIVLAKLDGTAKGGVVIGIRDALDIPVQWIGIGEQAEDLRRFEPTEFVEALLG